MYFFLPGVPYRDRIFNYVLYADSFSLGLLVWMLRLMNFNELLVFIGKCPGTGVCRNKLSFAVSARLSVLFLDFKMNL